MILDVTKNLHFRCLRTDDEEPRKPTLAGIEEQDENEEEPPAIRVDGSFDLPAFDDWDATDPDRRRSTLSRFSLAGDARPGAPGARDAEVRGDGREVESDGA